MSTTALIHEAYLRLASHDDPDWQNRGHFLAVASRAMRQILIDYSRGRDAAKRGGEWSQVTLDEVDALFPGARGLSSELAESLVRLDVALSQLERESPRHCRIVECRFFGGLTIEETATALGLSSATVKRGWRLARSWLHREMASEA